MNDRYPEKVKIGPSAGRRGKEKKEPVFSSAPRAGGKEEKLGRIGKEKKKGQKKAPAIFSISPLAAGSTWRRGGKKLREE